MRIRPILIILALTALVAVLTLKPLLHAQQASPTPLDSVAGRFHRPGHFMVLRRVFEKLQVNDVQKQAALGVLRNHQPALKPLVDSLVKERIALHDLSKAPVIDEAAVRAQSAKVAAVEADLAVQKAYLIHDLRAVATPEQLQDLDKMETDAETRLSHVIALVNDWIANS